MLNLVSSEPIAAPAGLPAGLVRAATASGAQDDGQAAHRVRVGHLAEALALRLCLDAETARVLRLAAPLHDVGDIDDKAPGQAAEPPWPLTADEERRRLRIQPQRGAALLAGAGMPMFTLAAEIALNLHERWDGNGYPHGLCGEDIPVAARIVAVVDCFDSLTLRRRYRPARADDLALAMLSEQAGKAFDPAIVAVFIAHAAEMIALRDRVDATRPAVSA